MRVFLDSAVVVNQVNGESRVRREHLPLCVEARVLAQESADIMICHVRRSENREADALARRALASLR